MPVPEACRRLEAAGADVVGLNCIRGPQTMLPMLEEIRAAVDVPVAALPVPYRTTDEAPNFQSLRDPHYPDVPPEGRAFPTALDPFTCNRYEIADFARAAHELGVGYLGRVLRRRRRTTSGRWPRRSAARPPASRYSADMTKHAFLGIRPAVAAEVHGVRVGHLSRRPPP